MGVPESHIASAPLAASSHHARKAHLETARKLLQPHQHPDSHDQHGNLAGLDAQPNLEQTALSGGSHADPHAAGPPADDQSPGASMMSSPRSDGLGTSPQHSLTESPSNRSANIASAADLGRDGWDDDWGPIPLADGMTAVAQQQQQVPADQNPPAKPAGSAMPRAVPMHSCWAALFQEMVRCGCMMDVFNAIDGSCSQGAAAAAVAAHSHIALLDPAEAKALIGQADHLQGESTTHNRQS